jgi:glycosyltransferase involved in cell wall biosynthesis
MTRVPERPSSLALRLSQPWHIQEMAQLHQAALFNVYFVLDTIAWDIGLTSAHRVDGTWSFLADYADGLLFDSAFTEGRFLTRFAVPAETPHAVCRYPFDPDDYRSEAASTDASGYILVVGNDYPHKDTVQTVELISSAFPFRPVVSLGPALRESRYLRVHRSGALQEIDVKRLYAGADLVIFPSFYEGFGFPIVTALAYGKTLVARKSQLLDEIAARCSSGRVVEYTHRDQLIETIGRLLNGGAVETLPLGTVVAETQRRWRDVARDIVDFVSSVIADPVRSRWLKRAHAINQLLAFGN